MELFSLVTRCKYKSCKIVGKSFQFLLALYLYCVILNGMTTVKMTLSGIMKRSGLKESQVRWRIKQLDLHPEKLHDRLFLFSEEEVRQIEKYNDGSAQGRDAHIEK